jgi:hypothetical protein
VLLFEATKTEVSGSAWPLGGGFPVTTRLSIDRFEGDRKQIAVLLADDGTPINFPKAVLPRGSKPADILTFNLERDTGRE